MIRERGNNLTETGSRAEVTCRQALARAGFAYGHTPASFHWSQLVNPRGDKNAAIEAYMELLRQEPESKSALEGLAYLYQITGRQDQARHYRRRLFEVEASQYGVDEPAVTDIVNYLLARTGDAELPERMPSALIQKHFDSYADYFEHHLTNQLEYCVPKLIESFLNERGIHINTTRILDIGCGTGLVAERLKIPAGNIDGLDISAKMLAKARARGIYSQLLQADFTTTDASIANDYSLIIAADVLNYQGQLSPVFKNVKKWLSAGGAFIFTVEKSEHKNISLGSTGRFQHSPEYIDRITAQHQFEKLHEQEVILRKEQGQAVTGLLYCFKH
jgi:predicted TPR repeat methyltransferase